MKYSQVYIDAIGYELPPLVVTTHELEARLRPVYQALHLPEGQLEALTGIVERRWWEPGYPVSQGAALAARKALALSRVRPQDVEVLLYAAVCREQFEPATACKVAAGLGISPDTVYDISNACLGVLNGIVDLANREVMRLQKLVEDDQKRKAANPASFIPSVSAVEVEKANVALIQSLEH